MYKVRIILVGPRYAYELQGHCVWISVRGLIVDWAFDQKDSLSESVPEDHWAIVFSFDNKDDAMLFRLARA